MKVFVYFNLHKKCLSLKALDGKHKGLVVAHAKSVFLKNVQFKVSEAGRQRVLKEKRKNVHAGVVGSLTGVDFLTNLKNIEIISEPNQANISNDSKLVSYNPYRFSYFFFKENLKEIKSANSAFIKNKEIFV